MYVDFTNKTVREYGQLNRKQLAAPTVAGLHNVHTEIVATVINGPGPLRPPAVTSVKLVLTFRLHF